MIVDSSALVEIALGKPDAEVLMVALARPDTKRISAGNLLETWMVIDRRGIPEAATVLDDTIKRAALIVEPVTEAQVAIALGCLAAIRQGVRASGAAELWRLFRLCAGA